MHRYRLKSFCIQCVVFTCSIHRKYLLHTRFRFRIQRLSSGSIMILQSILISFEFVWLVFLTAILQHVAQSATFHALNLTFIAPPPLYPIGLKELNTLFNIGHCSYYLLRIYISINHQTIALFNIIHAYLVSFGQAFLKFVNRCYHRTIFGPVRKRWTEYSHLNRLSDTWLYRRRPGEHCFHHWDVNTHACTLCRIQAE